MARRKKSVKRNKSVKRKTASRSSSGSKRVAHGRSSAKIERVRQTAQELAALGNDPDVVQKAENYLAADNYTGAYEYLLSYADSFIDPEVMEDISVMLGAGDMGIMTPPPDDFQSKEEYEATRDSMSDEQKRLMGIADQLRGFLDDMAPAASFHFADAEDAILMDDPREAATQLMMTADELNEQGMISDDTYADVIAMISGGPRLVEQRGLSDDWMKGITFDHATKDMKITGEENGGLGTLEWESRAIYDNTWSLLPKAGRDAAEYRRQGYAAMVKREGTGNKYRVWKTKRVVSKDTMQKLLKHLFEDSNYTRSYIGKAGNCRCGGNYGVTMTKTTGGGSVISRYACNACPEEWYEEGIENGT